MLQTLQTRFYTDWDFYRRVLAITLPIALQNVINLGVNMMDIILLGQLGVGEATTNAVGNIGGMVMAFMGGAWISLDLLGAEMQTAAKFFPTYWYTQAVTESAHLAEVTWETAAPILANLGVIGLFAAAVFAVALAAGRWRMRSAEAGGNAAASLTGA